MLSVVKSYALDGVTGYRVDVEVDIAKGVPSFEIVGLATAGVKEARDRIRTAIQNSSFDFKRGRVTVNLAPADIKKQGSHLELAMAVGFLTSSEQLPENCADNYIVIGELSLDGGIRHVNGVMPMLISAFQSGYKKFIIPFDNAREAQYIEGVTVYAVKNLGELVLFFSGEGTLAPVAKRAYSAERQDDRYGVDFKDVKGQAAAKRALEIAVAGAHNLIMSGPPGAGKTMLAKCIPTIMPEMTFDEAIEVTKLHSIAGVLDRERGIVTVRPFRTPHHTASLYSLTGGGAKAMPGEVSLSHNGVLFLDELPEYSRKTLETLRQPLEDGFITVSRVNRTVEYPAHFMLVASMNPCPCGNYGSSNAKCICTARDIRNYLAKLSGPLLDRIDLRIEVDNVTYSDLRGSVDEETSASVRERVARARRIQTQRLQEEGIHTNAEMTAMMIDKYCQIDAQAETLLANAFKRLGLSARGTSRILKTARTIADLAGDADILSKHIAEAIRYRTIEKKDYDQ